MKTYRTYLGYKRTTQGERLEFREFLEGLTPITPKGCWHWQCGCGGLDMVEYKGRVYCKSCGRIRCAHTTNGTIYYTPDDIKNCNYCYPH